MEKNEKSLTETPQKNTIEKITDYFRFIPKKNKQILLWSSILVIVAIVAISNIMSWTTTKWHGSAWDINLDDLLNDSAVNKQEITNCLNDKWVTFYGSASCGFSKEDVKKYGNDMKNFPIVDCDEEKTLCDMAGITQCPARSDGNTTKYDIKSINDLWSAFGCTQ